jgi:hypothetical protein
LGNANEPSSAVTVAALVPASATCAPPTGAPTFDVTVPRSTAVPVAFETPRMNIAVPIASSFILIGMSGVFTAPSDA